MEKIIIFYWLICSGLKSEIILIFNTEMNDRLERLENNGSSSIKTEKVMPIILWTKLFQCK